ncbi:GntR family transcriptional regulator [Amnibacterium flavum]|uniref:GntR family transcriptional regulator n=1 Tax=Amnibacterium flavum TaxID=2173173 RepID=A0A2V1HRI2_9MICO|nr:GntR family transcriptional regulator [Amnibacterium flavum]PVZ95185.1 GntR family transcriptional regulator [Amnibacterium flavum]
MDQASPQAVLLEKLAANPLSRTGGIALYWQCSELLKRLIEESHYPAAVPLPAENELAKALGVSRPTLRQAMARLASDGIIHSQRGVGAFALRSGLVRPVGLSSLYRDLADAGQVPTTKVLVLEQVNAEPTVAAELHIPVGTPLLHIERVRFADGTPVVVTRSLLALPDGVTLTREQLESDGLYNLLRRVASIELVGGSQTVSARHATAAEAELLDLPSDSAVMVAHRVTFDSRGNGIEYVHIIYPGGTELSSDLRGTSTHAAEVEARR